ncbi:MAG: hypothetical protein ACJ8C4_16740 [Gemmataceae bacterium]
MAHSHAKDSSGYFLEQLCTVGACGALGVVAVLMWQQDRLSSILAPTFFGAVLYGGIGLLALVVIRAISLWLEAGRVAKKQHEHHHEHEHTHDDDCDHAGECDHDHVHEWTPAKYSVLLLPVVLFSLGLPHQGFSTEGIDRMLGRVTLEGDNETVAAKAGTVLGFRELADAAYSPASRNFLEGKTGQLQGMFMRLGSDREFTLFRIKMRCCAADAVPVQVRIISPASITNIPDRQWVEVKGRIQFRKVRGLEKYIPVLMLDSPTDVTKMDNPPENEFDVQ